MFWLPEPSPESYLESSFPFRLGRAMRSRNGNPLLYGSIDDVMIVTAVAFQEAKKVLRILSSDLDIAAYRHEDVQQRAQNLLLASDAKVEILVEAKGNFDWTLHPFIQQFEEHWMRENPRLDIRVVPKEWVSRYDFNFILLDDCGVFYQDHRDQPAWIGIIQENGKTMRNLSGHFATLWNAALPLTGERQPPRPRDGVKEGTEPAPRGPMG